MSSPAPDPTSLAPSGSVQSNSRGTSNVDSATGATSRVSAYGAGSSGTGELSLPSVTVPSGGGTIRELKEAFDTNIATGTASLSLPIPLTKCPRWGTPSLSLVYGSAAGNNEFGLGWDLSGLMYVQRRTSNGLPKYDDEEDTFMFSGEELVPAYKTEGHSNDWVRTASGKYQIDDQLRGDYVVRRYRPRLDHSLQRIERWTKSAIVGDVHWRVMSSDNKTYILGRSTEARVSSGDNIFTWLLEEAYDSYGGAQLYQWKAEDGANVDLSLLHEQSRTPASRSTCKILKRVKYGNTRPNRSAGDGWQTVVAAAELNWHFELVLDYGEHHPTRPAADDDFINSWTVRKDPFSSYLAGFEVRHYRLCRRLLMYHCFERELGRPSTLVSSLDLVYDESPTISFLKSATQVGYAYARNSDEPMAKKLPPFEITYSQPPTVSELQEKTITAFDSESTASVPWGKDGQLQWVDLFGDGTTGILGKGVDSWHYKRNCSVEHLEPKLAQTMELPIRPSLGGPKSSLVDLNGDGLVDVVVNDGEVNGYYKGTRDAESGAFGWTDLKPFLQHPNIDLEDGNVRMIDLNGDGRADILMTTDDVFIWYPSQGFDGYGSPLYVHLPREEDKGPRVLFSDPTQSIFLADMSGDGLIDIVRIRNSEICYWPNLGYGQFGAKIAMDNSPSFDHDDAFNYRQLLLCDVDGSGSHDLVYFHSSGATVYFNHSGNGWSEGVLLEGILPADASLTQVAAVDLFGTGTACLVYSSSASASRQTMGFVDLMGGIKPHLLTRWTSNMGAETVISYRSSTTYYIEDEEEGQSWLTRIPFPVHCVSSVMTHDFIHKRSFTTRYRYHHGFYDGVEREFCGFGMVEAWDTEEFSTHAKLSPLQELDDIDEALHSPPVHTKTWLHTGAFADLPVMRSMYARSFHEWSGVYRGTKDLFLDDFNGTDYTEEELREATRALKGATLHAESYDCSVKDATPFAMKDMGSSVRMLQPQGQNKRAVFQSYGNETFNVSFDSDRNDPKVAQNITLKVDRFGNALKSVSVSYGRRDGITDPMLAPEELAIQRENKVVYKEINYTAAVDTELDYLTPRSASASTFEIGGLSIAGADYYAFQDFAGVSGDFKPLENLKEVGYHEMAAPGEAYKRLLGCSRAVYRSNDLTHLLPLGSIESLGLLGNIYALCFNEDIVKIFDPVDTRSMLTTETIRKAAYVDLDGDGRWWTRGPTLSYIPADAGDGSAASELAEAQSSFFLPKRLTDPYGAVLHTAYDDYSLLSIRSTDPVGNVTAATNDYCSMAPEVIVDCNLNKTNFAWDAHTRLVGIARAGKDDGSLDTPRDFQTELDKDTIQAFWKDPLSSASKVLGSASTRYVFDEHSFYRDGQPVISATVTAELHGNHHDRKTQLNIAYKDASGQTVQDASPAPGGKWLISGWQVLNNKNLVVRHFEPIFRDSHDFKYPETTDQSQFTFYDALQRGIAELYADHSWTKTVYGNWRSIMYDQNDLVGMNPSQDEVIGRLVKKLPDNLYLPTWYQTRSNGQLGAGEKTAAEKTLKHDNTPIMAYVDSQGRTFLGIVDMGNGVIKKNRQQYDIEGRLLAEFDEQGRIVSQTVYDMASRALVRRNMDKSDLRTFYNADGSGLYEWQGKDSMKRTEYDLLRRSTRVFVQESGSSVEVCTLESTYGDTADALSDREKTENNLRFRLYKQHDQSGIRTQKQYDMQGSCISAVNQLASAYKETVDWSKDVQLDTEEYSVAYVFDAIGRLLAQTSSDGTVSTYGYNEHGLISSLTTLLSGEQIPRSQISGIEYDARLRQIRCVQNVNQTETLTVYDKTSHHLVRKSLTCSGKIMMDVELTYDCTGRLLRQHDNAAQTIYFRNAVVPPTNEYTYDTAYQLVEASGREHLGQTGGKPSGPGSPEGETGEGNTLAPGDGTAVARYTETYEYDLSSNMTRLRHTIDDRQNPGWSRNFSYDNPSNIEPMKNCNQLSQTSTNSETSSYKYDAFGNTISMPTLSRLTWNYENELRSSSSQIQNDGRPETTWYVYNVFGKRVRKVTERQLPDKTFLVTKQTITVEGTEKVIEYDGRGEVSLQCDTIHQTAAGDSAKTLIERWSGPRKNAKGLPSLLIRFQHTLILDSVVIELDDGGNLISVEEYTPYGSTVFQTGLKKAPKRYRFAGKERDSETGLYYCHRRYYAPWLCRWVNCDPLGTSDGLNVYEYVGSDPINSHDPQGTMKGLSKSKKRSAEPEDEKKSSKKPKRDTSTEKRLTRSAEKPAKSYKFFEGEDEGGSSTDDDNDDNYSTRSGGNRVIKADSFEGRFERTYAAYYPQSKSKKKTKFSEVDEDEMSDTRSGMSLEDRGKLIQELGEAYDNAHLIPHSWEGLLHDASVIEADEYCLRVRRSVNQIEMRGKGGLDDMWEDWASTLGYRDSSGKLVPNLVAIIRMARTGQKNEAQKAFREAFAEIIENSGYISMEDLEEYRVPFNYRPVEGQKDMKFDPPNWSKPKPPPPPEPGLVRAARWISSFWS